MKERFFKSRLGLVATGIALGYLARIVLGAPAEEAGPTRTIDRPLPANVEFEEEVIDLPIIKDHEDENESGLVPPIRLPGMLPSQPMTPGQLLSDEFAHDSAALFEPHGEELCASGCAASRHPTEKLSLEHFEDLLVAYTYEPMDQTNNALEELLYFGPQTRKMIELHGVGNLDSTRAEFLWEQLKYNRAKISIRVVDDSGEARTWIEPTEVPFDRRHVFEMKTKNVQALVTSGTVKRVGLNHIWCRL